MTAQEFITANDIKLDYTSSSNPLMGDDMFHYNCTLSVGNRSMSLPYSKGGGCLQLKQGALKRAPFSGVTAKNIETARKTPCHYDFKHKQFRPNHGGATRYEIDALRVVWEPAPPTVEEVIECLAMDASVLDSPSFDDWANELGYDTDSIKAKSIYDACIQQTLAFRGLIGNDRLEQLREIEF